MGGRVRVAKAGRATRFRPRTRGRPRSLVLAPFGLIALTQIGLAAGCSSMSTESDAGGTRPAELADKQTNGEVRTDLEPLTKRWPFIETESAQWMSGYLGNPRVPGPESYWIDAVIKVSDEAMTRLTTDYELAPIDPPTGVEPQIEELIPDGVPLGSEALDAETYETAGGEVFVYPDDNTVVVVARFGN